MALTATNAGGGKEFETVPEGMFNAICYRVIDMGTQTNPHFEDSRPKHEVSLGFEIVDEDAGRMTDERRFSAHNSYTVSLNEKAKLRKHLESWRGKKFTDEELKGFELDKLVGQPVMIQVMHSTSKDGSRTYANVNNLLPSKDKDSKLENDPLVFNMDSDDAQEVIGKLSGYMQDKILESPEAKDSGLVKVDPVEQQVTEDTVANVPDGDIDLSSIPF